jgi:uncharacterized protein YjbJ (UPF0337 family)
LPRQGVKYNGVNINSICTYFLDRGFASAVDRVWRSWLSGEDPYRPLFTSDLTTGDLVMDEDRIKGSFKKFSGSIKENVGKLIGDKKTEAEGRAEKTEGEIQNAVGGTKDTIRKNFSKW